MHATIHNRCGLAWSKEAKRQLFRRKASKPPPSANADRPSAAGSGTELGPSIVIVPFSRAVMGMLFPLGSARLLPPKVLSETVKGPAVALLATLKVKCAKPTVPIMAVGVVLARSDASKVCEGGVVVPILGPNSELPLKMYAAVVPVVAPVNMMSGSVVVTSTAKPPMLRVEVVSNTTSRPFPVEPGVAVVLCTAKIVLASIDAGNNPAATTRKNKVSRFIIPPITRLRQARAVLPARKCHVRQIHNAIAIDVHKDVVSGRTGVVDQHEVLRIHHAIVIGAAFENLQHFPLPPIHFAALRSVPSFG